VALGTDVELVLAPGEEALRTELTAKYGDAVSVSVCPKIEACALSAG
jgi:hypothetical protein